MNYINLSETFQCPLRDFVTSSRFYFERVHQYVKK